MAAAPAIIKKLFGPNSVTRQFFVWSVAQQLVQSALAPMFQAILNRANTSNPNVPATPAELADMVVRGIAGRDWAHGEARKSGTSPEILDLMIANATVPPAIGDMLRLWRHGKVTRDDVLKAIRQARIKPEWENTILLMGIEPPTPAEILRALLQGQVDYPTALTLFQRLGGDPDYFELLYNTEGSAPTPNEAAEMARKRIIPWEGTGPGVVSFEQAFLEGPWRNKWLEPWRKSSEYLPPPRTITAMLREGSITVDEAKDLLARQGVPPDLIPSYISDASSTKVQEAKKLTESTLRNLFEEHAIDEATVKGYLAKLKYEPHEADFVVTSWQLNRELRARNTAITTVHTQYINHRIGNSQASQALDRFGVPPAQRASLIALWTEEAKTKVTLLTPAQIKSAVKSEVLSYDEALQRLIQVGYDEDDAFIFLEI